METGETLTEAESSGTLTDRLRAALESGTSGDIEFTMPKTGADHGFGGIVNRNPEVSQALKAYYQQHGTTVEEVAHNRLTVTGLPGETDSSVYWTVITDPQDETKIQVRVRAPRVS